MAASSESPQRSKGATSSFGTLRVALIAHIPALLDDLGCDGASALQRAGIASRLLANGENRIGFQAAGRLMEEGVRASGLIHFGLLSGERFEPSVGLGSVVELMLNAPSVDVALRAFVLHHHLNDSGAVPVLLPVRGRRVVMAYVIFGKGIPAIDTFYDAALAYGIQILRMICGKAWRPLEVKLAHRSPPDMGPYRRVFGSRICFDTSLSTIEFSADVLSRPIPGADAARYALLVNEMRQRHLGERLSLADQVRRAFLPMILAGTASAPGIADLFSISDRVMRQRLAGEGMTVRGLLLQTRIDLAAQLLRSTQLTVAEIGAAVGYSDPPSFVRAFKGHMGGMTPGAWRMGGI